MDVDEETNAHEATLLEPTKPLPHQAWWAGPLTERCWWATQTFPPSGGKQAVVPTKPQSGDTRGEAEMADEDGDVVMLPPPLPGPAAQQQSPGTLTTVSSASGAAAEGEQVVVAAGVAAVALAGALPPASSPTDTVVGRASAVRREPLSDPTLPFADAFAQWLSKQQRTMILPTDAAYDEVMEMLRTKNNNL